MNAFSKKKRADAILLRPFDDQFNDTVLRGCGSLWRALSRYQVQLPLNTHRTLVMGNETSSSSSYQGEVRGSSQRLVCAGVRGILRLCWLESESVVLI